ncbi:MAG: hypothetical protein ACE1Z4_03440, partial [Gammaproteobacteria bacterium]
EAEFSRKSPKPVTEPLDLHYSVPVLQWQFEPPDTRIPEFTSNSTRNYATAAYGRKQTFGLSLNGRSLTSALEKKADIGPSERP